MIYQHKDLLERQHICSQLIIFLILSIYGLGTASNGGGSDSIELTLPAISVNAGDDILLARDTNAIHLYFGSCFNSFEVIIPVVTTGVAAVSQNGNDAIELFKNGVVIETFGDINVDGTGTPWEYADSGLTKMLLDPLLFQ